MSFARRSARRFNANTCLNVSGGGFFMPEGSLRGAVRSTRSQAHFVYFEFHFVTESVQFGDLPALGMRCIKLMGIEAARASMIVRRKESRSE